MECASVVEQQIAKTGPADAHRILQHGLKNGLQLARRTTDDLKYVGGSGLLLQGFAQFVEQARILDGDDGLGGEVLHKLDLLVAEGANFLAVDDDSAD